MYEVIGPQGDQLPDCLFSSKKPGVYQVLHCTKKTGCRKEGNMDVDLYDLQDSPMKQTLYIASSKSLHYHNHFKTYNW
jgi:hypothetical protein